VPVAADDPLKEAGCVKQLTVQRVDSITAKGTLVAGAAGDTFAKSYVLSNGAGDDVREIVPPPSWRPLNATDEELRTYGFPARPSEPAARSAWHDQMAGWKGAGKPEMCETAVYSGVTHEASSPYWAGGMAVNGSATVSTFTSSDGKWYEPTFVSTCAASGYAIWSGLGGWNSGRLIQSGVDNAGAGLNTNYMFWEVISPQHGNPEVRWTDTTVGAGAQVESWVYYDNGTAVMWVENISTGRTHSITTTSYAGQAMSGYYDGTTADFITEAPGGGTASGGRFYLRRPSGDATTYYYAVVNGLPIGEFRSWRIREDGVSGRRMQNSLFNGVSAWNDFWVNCS
jgi:hypothetical protein